MRYAGIPEFMQRFGVELPPQGIGAAALAVPMPAERSLTLLEAGVLGKMQTNPHYVDVVAPIRAEFPAQHQMQIVAKGTGGAILNAAVFSRRGHYQGLRLSGPLVAEQLGDLDATLYSGIDGKAYGERELHSPTANLDNIRVDGGWQRAIPERYRTTGRLGLLFFRGEPYQSPRWNPKNK